MRAYDIAMVSVALAVLAAPICLVCLLRTAWRRHAWSGLKVSLVVLVGGLALGLATKPSNEVLQAEAAARQARAEQLAQEKAEKDAADAIAKAAQREKDAAEHAKAAAAAAEATRVANLKAAEDKALKQKQKEEQVAALRAPKPLLRDGIGCTSREAIQRLTKIAVSGDKEALAKLGMAMVATGQCRMMQAGTRIYLEDTAVFSGLMCGRPAGETRCYWLPIDITA
jgi:hypothetical protein